MNVPMFVYTFLVHVTSQAFVEFSVLVEIRVASSSISPYTLGSGAEALMVPPFISRCR